MGAVNEVVPIEELEARVEETARIIARVPRTTLMLTKTLIRPAWDLMSKRTHMQMSTDLMDLATLSKDVKEHIAKMRERSHKHRQTLEGG